MPSLEKVVGDCHAANQATNIESFVSTFLNSSPKLELRTYLPTCTSNQVCSTVWFEDECTLPELPPLTELKSDNQANQSSTLMRQTGNVICMKSDIFKEIRIVKKQVLSHVLFMLCLTSITLPASAVQLEKLACECSNATFGKDVYDPSYRKPLKLNPEEFVSDFHPANYGILDIVRDTLVPNATSLGLGCTSWGLFQNTRRYTSASLVSDMEKWRKAEENQSNNNIHLPAFYSDCEHEVKSGYRLLLTYNLYSNGKSCSSFWHRLVELFYGNDAPSLKQAYYALAVVFCIGPEKANTSQTEYDLARLDTQSG
ncbi:hypothetical protein SELMODRAFT_408665 [Selaginella moellendorffii]|uniref:Uncharacterized protein n=1 Tax=Selaginella moellendorffii TaxID=88036 RepID=D8R9J4_SELML|nr:hypothetical protein SELMODRAFT_408665 [Selaginella moellendorffii]